MQITPPTAAELELLLAQHAHRFPRKASMVVRGERGVRLPLPVLLGLPSGACRMPKGARISPVWQTCVGSVIRRQLAELSAAAEDLAADCLLWPSAGTFAAWRAQWPGLAEDLSIAAWRMAGAAEQLEEPPASDAPPGPVAALLEEHPRAAWQQLRLEGRTYDLVIDAPGMVAFDVFHDAFARKGEDLATLTRDFAEGQTLGIFESLNGEARAMSEYYDRHPGAAVRVALFAYGLGGTIGEVRLGEW